MYTIDLISPRKVLLASALLLQTLRAHSQIVTETTGAIAHMKGAASVADVNVFASSNNPAAITGIKTWQAGIYTQRRFNQSVLTLSNISFVVPFRHFHVAASLDHYGYELFNRQRASVSLARQLSKTFSLGVQLNYVSVNISEYGHSGKAVSGIGIWFQPVAKLRTGLFVFNAEQRQYDAKEAIPALARLGLSYEVSSHVTLHSEAEQVLEQAPSFKTGIVYKPSRAIGVAMGFRSNPSVYTFGTSLFPARMQIDFAAGFYQTLGFFPHLALSMPITPKP